MYIIRFLALCMLPVLTWAESYECAGDFLRLGAGARAAGMGGAVVPITSDATATYWNPAGLALLPQREVAFMHSEMYGGAMKYDAVCYAVPVKGVGGIGITLLRLGMDGLIPITALADTTQAISADNPILQTGTMSSADYALLLGHGMRFTALNMQAGITMKLIRRSVGEYYAHGIGADVGLRYTMPSGATLGLTVRDATGSIIAWDNGTRDFVKPEVSLGASYGGWLEELRGNITVSGSYCPDALFDGTASVSASPVERYVLHPVIAGGIGVEYTFKKTVFIRAGTVDRNVSAGFGFTYAGFNADYAFTLYNMFESKEMRDDLERTHRVSGAFRF